MGWLRMINWEGARRRATALLVVTLAVFLVAGCTRYEAATPSASPTTVRPSLSPTKVVPSSVPPTETIQAPLPPTSTPGSLAAAVPRFGINYVYHGLKSFVKSGRGTAEEYVAQQDQKLCDLGIDWVRSGGAGDPTSLNWAIVEPQRGVFDLALHDLRVKASAVCPLRLLGNVDFSTVPDYAQVGGRYFDDASYLEYLTKIVERYDGDGVDDMPGLSNPIKYWEIGNEVAVSRKFAGTPQDYAHVLQISHESIKSNCPDCQVLIGGWIIGTGEAGQWDKSISYFQQVLAAGGGDYFDIMNYHEYNQGGDFQTYTHVDAFAQYLAQYSFEKSIWITEGNTPLSKKGQPVASLETQAQDIVKRYVISFDAGVDVYFWHGLDDVAGSPGVGLFDETGVPKPSYYNLKLLIASIKGFYAVERISLGDDALFFYRFDLGESVVYLLWADAAPGMLDLSRYIDEPTLELTHALTESGQMQPATEIVATGNVPVDKTPVFMTAHP